MIGDGIMVRGIDFNDLEWWMMNFIYTETELALNQEDIGLNKDNPISSCSQIIFSYLKKMYLI